MGAKNIALTKDILRFEGAASSRYWQRFAMLLGLSVVIATMGMLRNSGAVVIAAMLIAPMMTPILGIAAALVMGWTRRAAKLLIIVCLAALASIFVAWLLCQIADYPRGIIVPGQISARTDPGTEDLVIALAAGVAGAYVQINRAEISLLPGAAIGVSLVPPLSASGTLLYFGQPSAAYEASLIFATNLCAIIIAACIVYVASGARSVLRRGKRRLRFSFGIAMTMACLALIVVQLGRATYARYEETDTEARLVQGIADWAGSVSVEIARVDVSLEERVADVWLIVDLPIDAQHRVTSVANLLPEELKRASLRDAMLATLGEDFSVTIRYQTRIAGTVSFGSAVIAPATAPETEIVPE